MKTTCLAVMASGIIALVAAFTTTARQTEDPNKAAESLPQAPHEPLPQVPMEKPEPIQVEDPKSKGSIAEVLPDNKTRRVLPETEDPDKDAEPLPPAPKVNPESKHIEDPNLKGLIIEVLPDKKMRRVLVAAEVCQREVVLELFMCKKNTKEHEAILRTDIDALKIHEALILATAVPGKPTQFVNPKTEQAEYKPATGTKINVSVHYTKGGKTFTHPAQEWIWDAKKKAQFPYGWVFAGSFIIVDPCNGNKFYGANSGDVISISNFPYSMLEVPVEVSKDNDNLVYEARTERIPPLRSKVWVILEPVFEKK